MFYKLHDHLHDRDWSAGVPKIKQHLVHERPATDEDFEDDRRQDFEDARVQSQNSFLWFGDQVRQEPFAEGAGT